MNRMLSIAWKEMIQLRRDRLTMGMMFGIPIIQLLLFGKPHDQRPGTRKGRRLRIGPNDPGGLRVAVHEHQPDRVRKRPLGEHTAEFEE